LIAILFNTIAGYFNCSPGSRFFGEFEGFSNGNSLIMSDIKYLNSAYTYISDDGLKTCWIDHVLTTASVDKVIGNFSILNHRLRGSASPVLTATGFVNGKGQFSTPHRIDTP